MKPIFIILTVIAILALAWWWFNQSNEPEPKPTVPRTKTDVYFIGKDLIDPIPQVRYSDVQQWLKNKSSKGYDIEFDKNISLAQSWLFQTSASKITDDTYGKLSLKSVPLYKNRGSKELFDGWKLKSNLGYRSMVAGQIIFLQ